MWYKKKSSSSDKSKLISKLDNVFSLYIRLRDSKQYNYHYFRCISCGEIKPFDKADCGHYFSRSHMSTRFDENNANAECSYCNRFKSDHLVGYQKNLIKKIGQKQYDLLCWKHNQLKNYSEFELKELIKYYTALVKNLQSGL